MQLHVSRNSPQPCPKAAFVHTMKVSGIVLDPTDYHCIDKNGSLVKSINIHLNVFYCAKKEPGFKKTLRYVQLYCGDIEQTGILNETK